LRLSIAAAGKVVAEVPVGIHAAYGEFPRLAAAGAAGLGLQVEGRFTPTHHAEGAPL